MAVSKAETFSAWAGVYFTEIERVIMIDNNREKCFFAFTEVLLSPGEEAQPRKCINYGKTTALKTNTIGCVCGNDVACRPIGVSISAFTVLKQPFLNCVNAFS